MRQIDVIASILRREGKIDNFYSIHNRISLRLGARIKDLRDRGWVIRTDEQKDKNCIYTLIREPAPKIEYQIISPLKQPQLFNGTSTSY